MIKQYAKLHELKDIIDKSKLEKEIKDRAFKVIDDLELHFVSLENRNIEHCEVCKRGN